MARGGLIFCFFLYCFLSHSQETEAFYYKLDYNVPQSPALSILDANPGKIMRGSAAQEVVVSVANNFIGQSQLEPGLAADFNPFFIFGQINNRQEYLDNYWKRFLANSQFSFASSTSEADEKDELLAVGLRFTVFDKKDLLQNEQLGNRIDRALRPTEDPVPGEDVNEVVDNEQLLLAYEQTKEELRHTKGSALSFGLAHAGLAKNAYVHKDSLSAYRSQAWLSFQHDFQSGWQLMIQGMYRNNQLITGTDINEWITGTGIRYQTEKVNLKGELIYSTEHGKIDYHTNLEVSVMNKLLLIIAVGKETNVVDPQMEQLHIKPGLRWNLSERKAN